MDFHCHCSDSDCYCFEGVELTFEEQNEIILARILGEAMEYEIVAKKMCEKCTSGWHIIDADSTERVFKKGLVSETDKSSEESVNPKADGESQ